MQLKRLNLIWQVVGLGVVAGMRSASAPAIASHILNRHRSKKLADSHLGFVQSDTVAAISKVFAVGELIGDKLPYAPDRIAPAGLIFRCISGGLSGAAVSKAKGNNAILGAAIGSAAALASTFGSYFLRKTIVKKTEISDPVIGGCEDALVIVAGLAIIKTAR